MFRFHSPAEKMFFLAQVDQWKTHFQWRVYFVNKHTISRNPLPAINLSSFSSHLVIEHFQLPVVLLQLRELRQHSMAKVQVDQAGRAELGQPWLLWTEAVEGVWKGPEKQEENVFISLCLWKLYHIYCVAREERMIYLKTKTCDIHILF